MLQNYFKINIQEKIGKILFFLIDQSHDMICVDNTFSSKIIGSSWFFYLRSLTFFFGQSCKPIIFTFLGWLRLFGLLGLFRLLIFFLLESFLLKNKFSFDFCIFKLFLSQKLSKFFCQMRNKRSNILIWSELPSVINFNSAEGTFFFALSIVCFDTTVTETMHALLELRWIVHHFLANWACERLLYSSNKILGDHIVSHNCFNSATELLIPLIRLVINNLSFFIILFFAFFLLLFGFCNLVIDFKAINDKLNGPSLIIVILELDESWP